MREIVFDTETTGLSPANGDRVVEFGGLELIDRVETGRTFHAYFNPERPMDPAAQAVHGLSDAFLADKPIFADRVEELLDFLEDSPLVAHNAMFDYGFLNHELNHCGRLKISQTRIVDTLAIARSRHPGAKHSLDALCTRFGIDRSHRVKHGALLDAQLLAQIYVELTGGRQIGLSLDTAVTKTAVAVSKFTPILEASNARSRRVQLPTSEELERHAQFIAALDSPIWQRVT
jgi:DNA polymerase-3 subunit epsilon